MRLILVCLAHCVLVLSCSAQVTIDPAPLEKQSNVSITFASPLAAAARTRSSTNNPVRLREPLAPLRLVPAPLAETGFDSSLNGLNQTQQQSSADSQVQPIGNSSQFYKFYEFGFRLGHDQL